MPKDSTKYVRALKKAQIGKPTGPKMISLDDQLAEHLRVAEEHLIAAVELFTKKHRPDRTAGYQDKLTKAQEAVTALFREELVRMRGPMKVRRPRKAA